MRFEVVIDSMGGYSFLSSDDFEADDTVSLFDLEPLSIALQFNGHASKPLPLPERRNHSSFDYDVVLVPVGDSASRDYE